MKTLIIGILHSLFITRIILYLDITLMLFPESVRILLKTFSLPDSLDKTGLLLHNLKRKSVCKKTVSPLLLEPPPLIDRQRSTISP